ncbi:hypothetical protein COTS27_01078 [Spirochaetota bacterium]|nr:hypothetical protein COTS27_01078 [Spirochaetota bacterium]
MALEINDEYIDDDLIAEEFHHIKELYKKRQLEQPNTAPPLPDDETLVKLVKENIIRRTLLRQEVLKHDIVIDPKEIDAMMEALFIKNAKQPVGQSDPQNPAAQPTALEPPPFHKTRSPHNEFLSIPSGVNNTTKEAIRSHIETNLKIEKLLAKASADINPITERHIKIFYETNRDHYLKGPRFHLYYMAWRSAQQEHLNSVTTNANSTSTQHPKTKFQDTAKKHKDTTHYLALPKDATFLTTAGNLKKIIERLPNDEGKELVFTSLHHNSPFPSLKDPSSSTHIKEIKQILHQFHHQNITTHTGDLGIREDKELAPQILTAVKHLTAHELTDPVILEDCVYLFYVKAYYKAGIPALAEITDKIKIDLLREIRERKQDIYVTKLIEQSHITDYEYM